MTTIPPTAPAIAFLGTGRMGAPIVITMLADGPATEQAATGPDGLLAAGPGTVWVQMATVGAEWTARLASIADPRGIVFVDAPVSGSEGPARAGELVIVASGPQHVRDMLAGVRDTPCRRQCHIYGPLCRHPVGRHHDQYPILPN